jgi:hypothetical protein
LWELAWEPRWEADVARGGNLDVRTIEAGKPREAADRLSDGGGPLLIVKPSGAKVWLVRVTLGGGRRGHLRTMNDLMPEVVQKIAAIQNPDDRSRWAGSGSPAG